MWLFLYMNYIHIMQNIITVEDNDMNIIEDDSINVMELSSFSNMHMLLKYLVSVVRTESESESIQLTINPYIDKNNHRKVQFIVNNMIWCEIFILDKFAGVILDKTVSVNLYDFYHIIDNCRDEMISLRIDNDQLVVGSFYNENMDADELEVYLPISKIDDSLSLIIDTDELVTSIDITPITAFQILKELNIENKTTNILIQFNSGKISFVSEYNGIISKIVPKDLIDIDFGDAQSFSMPFTFFYLMVSTGEINGVKFLVYNKYVTLKTELYSFNIPITHVHDNIVENVGEFDKIFVMDTDQGFSAIEKITSINQTKYINEITYEKVMDGVADFVAKIDNRMTIYVRALLATISDQQIKFDGNIFRDLFTNNGVDAIGINRLADGRLYISYESATHYRTVIYDHEKFMKFRVESLK